MNIPCVLPIFFYNLPFGRNRVGRKELGNYFYRKAIKELDKERPV
jgi:hypothetical protein